MNQENQTRGVLSIIFAAIIAIAASVLFITQVQVKLGILVNLTIIVLFWAMLWLLKYARQETKEIPGLITVFVGSVIIGGFLAIFFGDGVFYFITVLILVLIIVGNVLSWLEKEDINIPSILVISIFSALATGLIGGFIGFIWSGYANNPLQTNNWNLVDPRLNKIWWDSAVKGFEYLLIPGFFIGLIWASIHFKRMRVQKETL